MYDQVSESWCYWELFTHGYMRIWLPQVSSAYMKTLELEVTQRSMVVGWAKEQEIAEKLDWLTRTQQFIWGSVQRLQNLHTTRETHLGSLQLWNHVCTVMAIFFHKLCFPCCTTVVMVRFKRRPSHTILSKVDDNIVQHRTEKPSDKDRAVHTSDAPR